MFDPYYKWLGIPPKDQPPNHYRLLAIDLFESDPEVIDAAANRQMAYVQQRATGEHTALSQKLLNELSVARLCLLDQKKRATYDLQLRINLKQQARLATGAQSKPQKPDKYYKHKSAETQTQPGSLPPPIKFKPFLTQIESTQQNPVSDNSYKIHKILIVLAGCFLLALVPTVFIILSRHKEPDTAAGSGDQTSLENGPEASSAESRKPPGEDNQFVSGEAAVYNVEINPPFAILSVRNNVGIITGSGSARQIRFENISGRDEVLISASCDGYKLFNQRLMPKPGQNENLSIVLQKIASTTPIKSPSTASTSTTTNIAKNLQRDGDANYPTVRDNRRNDGRNERLSSPAEAPKTERRKVFVFSGESAIVTPVRRSLPSTVEAWIWIPPPSETADMFVFGSDDIKQATGGLGVRIGKNGQLGGRRIQMNKKLRDFGTSELLPIQKWTHLAATFNDDKICLFVSGHLVHTNKGAQDTGRAPFVVGYIGYGPYKIPPCFFVGKIRTIRISSGIRYDGDFRPQFEFDKNQDEKGFNTMLIYDASSTNGNSISDLSGNKNHGQNMNIRIMEEDIPIQ